jgi:beta-xylosidase
LAMMGCYSFPSHVLAHHPGIEIGLSAPSLLDALRDELPAATVTYAEGCTVSTPDTSGLAAAVALAQDADVVVVALGDRAALFGRGTSGEGCDAPDLSLPGVQGQLLDALLDTEKPVVLVLITGRPYALGRYAGRAAAIVQAFFPGEEGGPALAGVLSGRVSPSGRLPVSIPADPTGQPGTYLSAPLGLRTEVSNLDPTPLYPFGYGLTATSFAWSDVTVDGIPYSGRSDLATDSAVALGVTVTNTGAQAGVELVQVSLHDPVAQTTRPVVRLVGFARVPLQPGESRRVSFDLHADLTSFTGVDGTRIVEPGDIELRLSTSSRDVHTAVKLRLTGPLRRVDHTRVLTAAVTVSP